MKKKEPERKKVSSDVVYMFLPEGFPKEQERDFQEFCERAAEMWRDNNGNIGIMRNEELQKLRQDVGDPEDVLHA